MNSLKIVIGSLFCFIVSLLECAPRKHSLLSRAPAMQAARMIPLASNPEAGQAGARPLGPGTPAWVGASVRKS
jgi:hypothetical protein